MTLAVTPDTTSLQGSVEQGSLGSTWSQRAMLYVCTGVSDGVSECVTMSLCFTRTHVVPLLAGEETGMAKGLNSPVFVPRSHSSF